MQAMIDPLAARPYIILMHIIIINYACAINYACYNNIVIIVHGSNAYSYLATYTHMHACTVRTLHGRACMHMV